jgi:hypothetical protein
MSSTYIPLQSQATQFSGIANTVYATLGTTIGVPLNGSSPFTFEAWVQFASVAQGNIISQDGVYAIGVLGGQITVEIENAPLAVASNPQITPLDTTNWHFIAVTFDGGTLTIYIDGLLSAQTAFGLSQFASSANPHLAGAGLAGYLGSIQLFNFAKTTDEIAGDPWTLNPSASPAPVALFDFTQAPPQDRLHLVALNTTAGVTGVLLTPCIAVNGAAYLRLPEEDEVNPGGQGDDPYTLQAWIYLAEPTDESLTQLGSLVPLMQVVVANNDLVGARAVALAISYLPSSREFQLAAQRGAWSDSPVLVSNISGGLAANTWLNVAVTYDGSVLTLYAGGAEVGSTTASALLPPFSSAVTTIGAGLNGSDGTYATYAPFDGFIANVCIWSQALTSSQVAGNQNTLPSIPTTGLVGLFRFAEPVIINAVTSNPTGCIAEPILMAVSTAITGAIADDRVSLSGPTLGLTQTYSSSSDVMERVAQLRASVDFVEIAAAADANLKSALDADISLLDARGRRTGLQFVQSRIVSHYHRAGVRGISQAAPGGAGVVLAHRVGDEIWFLWHDPKQSVLIGRHAAADVDSCMTWYVSVASTIIINVLYLVFMVPISAISNQLTTWIQTQLQQNGGLMNAIRALFSNTPGTMAMITVFSVLYEYSLLSSLMWTAVTNLTWWGLTRLIAMAIASCVTWQARVVDMAAALVTAVLQVVYVWQQRPSGC